MQQSEILYFVALWKTYGLRFCAEMQWFVDIGYPLLDAEHSLCTAPWSGTPCPTTSAHSRTMSPLDSAWKPGFSPDTSVFSALETFVIIALYKSTFTIPYNTIPRATTVAVGVLLLEHGSDQRTVTSVCPSVMNLCELWIWPSYASCTLSDWQFS